MVNQELTPQENAGALDHLPFNLTQLMHVASMRPRDPMRSIDNAIAQLRAMPKFAQKAYYSLPFKKKQADGTWKTEFVEGPSIKAATALTTAWGNNLEGGFIGKETDEYIDVTGYYYDLETGKMTLRPIRISKTYKDDKGTVQKWRKDMLDRQIAAGVSKAIRNADLNGLPAGFVEEYYAEAKRIVANGGVAPEPEGPSDEVSAAVIEKLMAAFEAMTVERSEVAGLINNHPEWNTSAEIAAQLQGILNALNEGQTTVDEVFTVPQNAAPIQQPGKTPQASSKPAARAPSPAKPPFPSTLREMPSKRESECLTCKQPIKVGQKIGYDAKLGRAHHREHFA